MSEVYTGVGSLEGLPKEGNGECVTLVKNHTAVGWTGNWRQGEQVVGNNNLARGTAIATFVDGRYPNHSHGNHAAFYMGQVSDGIYVMDQWRSKPKIGKRLLRRLGKDAHGRFISPSNNADAFFVIE
ncbi:BPSL0067 family protein [Massilia sp.]|uniref:BPSL0067 family protein n=1 Tax=Massilia sp. TaxID=1882437 RepID=UPI0028A23386|nr:BPSL0067 family protein [Massilia sp.]